MNRREPKVFKQMNLKKKSSLKREKQILDTYLSLSHARQENARVKVQQTPNTTKNKCEISKKKNKKKKAQTNCKNTKKELISWQQTALKKRNSDDNLAKISKQEVIKKNKKKRTMKNCEISHQKKKKQKSTQYKYAKKKHKR